jgi:DNA-binding MarR family transcriptional regulator
MYSLFMASLKSNETAVEDLKLALGLLIRRIRAAAPSESHDLSWTQKSVLVRLEKEGPATTSELARAEGVKPQSMGTAIAALEGMGMVERKADPTDGRQTTIKLTDKGSSMRRTTRDASLAWLAQAIAKLKKQEQATLFEAGEIIKRLVEL